MSYYIKQPLVQPPPRYSRAEVPPSQAYPYVPPPGYSYAPPTAPAWTANNRATVTHQPAHVHTHHTRNGTDDHYLTLSICLSICCCCCGTWLALFCTIPAIIFASNAKDAEERGDYNAMESNRRMALICNMVAVGVSAIIIILAIILLAVSLAAN